VPAEHCQWHVTTPLPVTVSILVQVRRVFRRAGPLAAGPAAPARAPECRPPSHGMMITGAVRRTRDSDLHLVTVTSESAAAVPVL
jgi:hypothetical protein